MDLLCRLCSRDSSSLTEVFSCLVSGRLLLDMIHVICPIKIFPDDKFPQRICEECLETIESAINLREKSVQSDQGFRRRTIVSSRPQLETALLEASSFPVKQEFIEVSENNFMSEGEDSWNFSQKETRPEDDDSSNSEEQFETTTEQVHTRSYGAGKLPCPYRCGQKFAFSSNVKRHVDRAHESDDLILGCNECNQRFPNKTRLKYHKTKYHSSNKESSDEANSFSAKNVSSIKRVSTANVSTARNKYGRYVCPYECGTTFAFPTNKKRHIIRFHEGDALIFPCQHCSYRFKTAKKLSNHLKNFHASSLDQIVHTDNKLERFCTCDFCGQRFLEKKDVLLHMQRLHNNKTAMFPCNICNVKLCDKDSLTIHTNTFHVKLYKIDGPTEAPKFSCTFCERPNLFVYRTSLYKHMRKAHYDELPFTCDICEQRFRDNKQLVKHFKVHED